MENGGIDVESFLFNSASQALFAFLQVCFCENLSSFFVLYLF